MILPIGSAAACHQSSHIALFDGAIRFGSSGCMFSRVAPGILKRSLLKKVRDEIGEMVDVEKHFSPRYNPWDQRLCLVPDDDLFRAIQSGKASVVTDHIEKITEKGVQLVSGEHLDADIVVCATGLELVVLGGQSLPSMVRPSILPMSGPTRA